MIPTHRLIQTDTAKKKVARICEIRKDFHRGKKGIYGTKSNLFSFLSMTEKSPRNKPRHKVKSSLTGAETAG